MPRVYFGFNADSRPGEQIFLSYSRGDAARIKGIASELHRMGLPIWYDDGLIPGNRWKQEILDNVIKSRMTVFFLSKELFKRDKTYMIDEFRFAKDYKKPALCVWLDDLGRMDCTALSRDMYLWWKELEQIHSIEVFHMKTDAEKAKEIYEGICRKDSGFRQYAIPAPKPEQKPKLVQEPKPKPVQQPQSAQTNQPQPVLMQITQLKPTPQPVVSNKPTASVLKDSDSKPTKTVTKPATVKRTPLIITIAVVLVVAIVGGIWTTSALSGKIGDQIEASDLSGLNAEKNGNHFTFTFGNYKQGSDGEVKPIEWRVLAVNNGRALVISENLLFYARYNRTKTDVTWETCTIRKWLNNDFLTEAFSSSEQTKIATVTNQNPNNSKYGTKGGNATQDKIFALSVEEADKYFTSDSDRKACTTA